MQSLERDGLTAAQVAALLHGHRLEVSAGLDLLDYALNVVGDATDDLVAGTIHRSMAATIHGTCSLQLSRPLSWRSTLAKPYMLLSDGDISIRVNVGVFALTTPETPIGETPATLTVQGYDMLYLANRQVGDSYQVPAGGGYVAAMNQVVSNAGLPPALIDSSAQDSVLPVAMVWPLVPVGGGQPSTYLRILNDLAAAVNYRSFWADENGRLRSEPYVNPVDRPVEYVFDADDTFTIVGEQRSLLEDNWQQPNYWIFVQKNRTTVPTDGDGLYFVGRIETGDVAWRTQIEADVADQLALEAFGERSVAETTRRSSELHVKTGPFPFAGHADVLLYRDSALGERKVVADSWEFDLLGGDVTWVWHTT